MNQKQSKPSLSTETYPHCPQKLKMINLIETFDFYFMKIFRSALFLKKLFLNSLITQDEISRRRALNQNRIYHVTELIPFTEVNFNYYFSLNNL